MELLTKVNGILLFHFRREINTNFWMVSISVHSIIARRRRKIEFIERIKCPRSVCIPRVLEWPMLGTNIYAFIASANACQLLMFRYTLAERVVFTQHIQAIFFSAASMVWRALLTSQLRDVCALWANYVIFTPNSCELLLMLTLLCLSLEELFSLDLFAFLIGGHPDSFCEFQQSKYIYLTASFGNWKYAQRTSPTEKQNFGNLHLPPQFNASCHYSVFIVRIPTFKSISIGDVRVIHISWRTEQPISISRIVEGEY